MIRAPGPWSCGSTVAIRRSNPWLTLFWSDVSLWVALWVEILSYFKYKFNQLLNWHTWRTEEEFGSCCIRQRSANIHVLLVTAALGSLQEGAEWSVIWSTVCPPACATPPPRDTVHEPNQRLGYRNSKHTNPDYWPYRRTWLFRLKQGQAALSMFHCGLGIHIDHRMLYALSSTSMGKGLPRAPWPIGTIVKGPSSVFSIMLFTVAA